MANVNVKPLGDRVLLEIVEDANQMKGGIFIPDTAKEKPQEYRRIPRTFDAFVGKISRQAAAEPLGGMCSSLT